jgi:hypothetical protein
MAPAPRPYHAPARRCGPHPALIGLGVAALLFTGIPFALLAVTVAIGAALLAVTLALSFVLGPVLLVVLVIVLASRRRSSPPPMRWGPQH